MLAQLGIYYFLISNTYMLALCILEFLCISSTYGCINMQQRPDSDIGVCVLHKTKNQ